MRERTGMRDPHKIPAYSLTDAGRYLGVPVSTIRSWVKGRDYLTTGGTRRWPPIVKPAMDSPCVLSFENLVELHVLRATRNKGVRIDAIRDAVFHLEEKYGSQHPLAQQEMQTDGVSIFIEVLGKLIDVSHNGQVAIRKAIEVHLKRIERDDTGMPVRLYPFAQKHSPRTPSPVAIDPRVQFGRLCVTGTNITVDDLVSRHRAGEELRTLSRDFDTPVGKLRDAMAHYYEVA
ncbi:hypothetical protein PPSIR1_14830 [Plesiocystis pacifica SIR-1]|uniref:Putative antitoxin VapB45-like DNA-binding HTH domain-containing protein n=2 Tax=Plesiocystis pacifica TaxID=191768 RepID=A6GJM2_9BACT|nr:hypothetical protein PPSIR1_14830 [Plesiocystis pacifica SIR-1]